MFLEKEIMELEIKSQDSLEKRKVNDVEISSLTTQDSNLLLNDNKDLKLKIKDLTKIVTNLTNGKKNLDNLFSSQRCIFDKAGIGYNPGIKEKRYQKFFMKDNFLKTSIYKTSIYNFLLVGWL